MGRDYETREGRMTTEEYLAHADKEYHRATSEGRITPVDIREIQISVDGAIVRFANKLEEGILDTQERTDHMRFIGMN